MRMGSPQREKVLAGCCWALPNPVLCLEPSPAPWATRIPPSPARTHIKYVSKPSGKPHTEQLMRDPASEQGVQPAETSAGSPARGLGGQPWVPRAPGVGERFGERSARHCAVMTGRARPARQAGWCHQGAPQLPSPSSCGRQPGQCLSLTSWAGLEASPCCP